MWLLKVISHESSPLRMGKSGRNSFHPDGSAFSRNSPNRTPIETGSLVIARLSFRDPFVVSITYVAILPRTSPT